MPTDGYVVSGYVVEPELGPAIPVFIDVVGQITRLARGPGVDWATDKICLVVSVCRDLHCMCRSIGDLSAVIPTL